MSGAAADGAAITAAVVMIVIVFGLDSLKVKIRLVDKYQLDKILGLILMVAAGATLAMTPVMGVFVWAVGIVEGMAGFAVGAIFGALNSVAGSLSPGAPKFPTSDGFNASAGHGLVVAGASLLLLRLACGALPKVSERRLAWSDVHLAVLVPLLLTVCLSSLGQALEGPVQWAHGTVGGWFEQQITEVP